MERETSSDEEGDLHNLIHQNDTENHRFDRRDQTPTTTAAAATSPRSTFHIEDFGSSVRRRFKLILGKRYLFVIFLPLVIILVYLSTGLGNYFSINVSRLQSGSYSGGVQELELQALYLLRQQQLSLLSLWNRISYTSNSSIFGSSVLIEDVELAVLNLISSNKKIQDVLLSQHRIGNFSEHDEVFANLLDDRCRRVDQRVSERKRFEWKPNPHKFLFAICLSGQMSNHLICLEKHMFFAALLNRVLVIPSHKFDYQYSRVLDINHINTCLGRNVVVSFEEFMDKKKKRNHHVHIDRFICYISSPQPCYMDEDHIKKLKGLGVSIGGKVEAPWVEDIQKPSKRTAKEVEDKFKTEDDVIAIGDVFYADVEKEWVMQPGGSIAHKCKTLIEPNRLILLTAQRFIQTFLGKNYIALHFRRHGFLKFCNAKTPSCFYPIPQAADCITKVVERANSPVIYLSTDAAESETGLLQSLLVVHGKTVPLVKRPVRNSAEKWDALLYRHGIEGDSQVEAMLDKTICAMSNVFIGASGSTFTEDILRLRKDWGTASLCDEYVCRGEEPNFIAEDE